ncbi:MAG: sigma-70 family RNA polymerase sigma factor [Anaerolineae bacterium]|nr:sigma-70 family RNA polymerase sigma factor [Anaerolineae bacterium]
MDLTAHEADLLERAKAGDRDAFADLHGALEPAVARFVRRLIGDGQEWEDLTQDTMTALYFNLDKITEPGMLRPFIFRVARNRCYDVLRRRGRHPQVTLDESEESEPFNVRVSFEASNARSTSLDETAHWLLLELEVREAMQQLPELQRQALILFAEEGMTYAEIAEIMDVSIGTIKSRIFHAKQRLRALLPAETVDAIEGNVSER